MPTLIYVADPMCAWSYAAAAELQPLLAGVPELELELVLGGLRAYRREAVTDEVRATYLEQWRKAREASGLPINDAILSREGLVFDTEPACRAVVTARMISAPAAPAVFAAIQHAFFVEGWDITDVKVLAEVAAAAMTEAGATIDATAFLEQWASDTAIQATHADFKQTRQWKIDGFPTIVLARGDQLDLIASGFMRTAEMVERIQFIIEEPEAVLEAVG